MQQQVPEMHCPRCGNLLDGITSVGHENAPKPGENSVTVCCYCGQISFIEEGGALRIATAEEKESMLKADPMLHIAIHAAEAFRNVPEKSFCPNCGQECIGILGVGVGRPDLGTVVGTVAVCGYCADILIVEANFQLRPATIEEKKHQMATNPALAVSLRTVHRMIAQRKARRARFN